MPVLDRMPLPTNMWKEGLDYLQRHGLNPVQAVVRSSGYELYRVCPLSYYLRYRLGLVKASSYSEALSRGSWFHAIMEIGGTSIPTIQHILDRRIGEVKELAQFLGLKDPQPLIEREEQDAKTALAWANAALEVDLGMDGTMQEYLSKNQTLATELTVSLDPDKRTVRSAKVLAQFDRLVYSEKENALWVVDYKTSSQPLKIRAATCPREFQTLLYLYILQEALRDGAIHAQFPTLPPDVRIGGMAHWMVQKPRLQLSGDDRAYTETAHVLKSGPRKGQTEIRREYYGEPLLENYYGRVADWMKGTGIYSHELPKRRIDPVVDLIRTPMSWLDLDNDDWFKTDLAAACHAATCDPYPAAFPPNLSKMREFGDLSEYYPFALTPLVKWPDLVKDENFIIDHR